MRFLYIRDDILICYPKNAIIKNNDIEDSKIGSPFSYSSNNSESENSIRLNENEESVNKKDEDSIATGLIYSLDDETDLCYDIQKDSNSFNLDLDLNK